MRRNGFTLLEMSIVLAVIALVAGGIMLGRGLLQASRVQAVLVGARNYSTAIQQFRDKYQALPGDWAEASRQWGRADGGSTMGAACPAGQTTSGKATCDGNGDGIINNVNAGSLPSPHEIGDEDGWAWQQLSAAGMIPGTYIGGVNIASAGSQQPGTNMPGGPWPSTMFTIQSAGTCVQGVTGSTSNCAVSIPGVNIHWSKVSANNMIVFTATDSYDVYPQMAAISPKDAYGIDRKVDDGMPAQGQVRAQIGKDSGLAGADLCGQVSSSQVVYRRDRSDLGCVLYFMDSFQNLNQQ